ncbi:lysophospholipid acyltransferase family protein [Helicobacter sp. MIT 99-5507]|uniref:lysophospholipid acyltransferase family protein n=1 Tax=Helicobacter sp. MIT 99-5507 TaxID=152489 RepID=UPI000E1E37ED|nr:lysophospholipid acyltransferase family protein [Helicobacter sp. MIT 99-5507]RDU57401.1 hypothetical protein CQA42_05545 [Helicobacter sp. MIT 99-5507]
MIFNKDSRRAFKRKIILLFAPRLVWIFLWILYLSCKNRFYIHDDIKKGNAILAFWHGEFLMLPFLYKKMRDKPKIFVISSEHFDGELMVKLYGYFGFKTIRGSNTRGGRRVLIQSFKKLEDGYDVAITPDGPKGPYHSIADGVVAMSQKTGIAIVPVRTIPNRFYELKTWDKFRIPKLFSKIIYISMPSFHISKDLNLEDAKELVYKQMTKDPNIVFKYEGF